MNILQELTELWTERRTRLLHNEKVYASEGEYARAMTTKAEAKATLDAIEDVERLKQRQKAAPACCCDCLPCQSCDHR